MYSAPVPAQEKQILEKLVLVRDRLLLLKQDKSTYVKSADVLPLYDEIVEHVHQLNDARTGTDKLVQNRVDSVLDDCLQLISLFFMAIGRNGEAPALYSMTSNIARLCDHLKEAAFYSTKDLDSLQHTIDRMRKTLDKDAEKYSPYLLERINIRIALCEKLLQELRDFLKTLSPEMVPKWETLVSLLRAVAALNTRSQYRQKDLDELRQKLLDIKAEEKDGQLPDSKGNYSGGSDLLVPLLNRCLLFCDMVQERFVY